MDAHLIDLMRAALELAITGIGALMLWILSDMAKSIKDLNVKMAVIVERVDTHEKRIDRLEKP